MSGFLSLRIVAVTVALLVAVSAAASLFETSATAQTQEETALPLERVDPSATTAIYGDWTVNCRTVGEGDEARKACESVQIVRIKPSNQAIAKVAIGQLPGSEDISIVFQTLSGVWLRDAVVLAASDAEDATAVEATYSRCQNGTCFADTELTREMISALISAPEESTALLTYTGRQRTALRIAISLNGFAPALAAAIE